MESRRIKKLLTRSLALLALVAVLAGCEITSKTANPDPVALGKPLIFTINVAFDPQDPGALVVDELPDSVQFVSASAGCQFFNASNSVGCFLPNFAGGGTATIVVTPTQCGTFTNTAFIPTIDQESVNFRVVGCEQPQAKQQPPLQPRVEQQQPAGAAPVTQESEQESEAGEIDQSFEVS